MFMRMCAGERIDILDWYVDYAVTPWRIPDLVRGGFSHSLNYWSALYIGAPQHTPFDPR